MAHHPFKTHLRFAVLLFGITLFFSGCQEDETIIVESDPQKRSFSYELVDLQQLKNTNPKSISELDDILGKINEVRNNLNKSESQTIISVDSTVIANIEHVSGYNSQTFLVESSPGSTVLENLIISNHVDGSQKALLIEYMLSSPISEVDMDDFRNYVIQTTVHDLEDYSLAFTSKSTVVCWWQLVEETTQCDQGQLITQSSHPECFDSDGHRNFGPVTIIYYKEICEIVGSGGGGGTTTYPDPTGPPSSDDDPFGDGGGSGGDGSNTGGGNDNDGNGNNDNPCQENGTGTSIHDGNGNCVDGIGVTLLPGPPDIDLDCLDLKTNSLSTDFKNRMQALHNNINGTSEFAFGLYNGQLTGGPGSANPIVSPIVEGTDDQNAPSAPFIPEIKGIAHNHLSNPIYNHIGTFSPNDIIALSNLMVYSEEQTPHVAQSELGTYLVCEEGNYALKIEDKDKLYAFALRYDNDKKYKRRIDKFYEDNKIEHGKPKQDQNIGFLMLLKKYDLGVQLYESDDNYENWGKLELNDNENDINKTPCN